MPQVARETELYPPVRDYLIAQGYEVKSEIGACDVVARRDGEPPVVVELKRQLGLDIILQAVDRLLITEHVYIGIARGTRRLRNEKRVLKLCRMLGIGVMLIDVGPRASKPVRILLDPAPYAPRISKHRQARLLREFELRVGDPNAGGSDRRAGIMTFHRQQALAIARFLASAGASKASDVAAATGVGRARDLMYRNVYGWFERERAGIYRLSPRGRKEYVDWENP